MFIQKSHNDHEQHDNLIPEHMEYIIRAEPDYTKEQLEDVVMVEKIDDNPHDRFDRDVIKEG